MLYRCWSICSVYDTWRYCRHRRFFERFCSIFRFSLSTKFAAFLACKFLAPLGMQTHSHAQRMKEKSLCMICNMYWIYYIWWIYSAMTTSTKYICIYTENLLKPWPHCTFIARDFCCFDKTLCVVCVVTTNTTYSIDVAGEVCTV